MRIIKKGLNIQLSPHLNQSEIDCNCDRCGITIIDDDLIEAFERFRESLGGIPLFISSGYRCEAHNKDLESSAELSMHQLFALDILKPHKIDYVKFQIETINHFNFVMHYYNPERVHVDMRGINYGKF